MYVIIQGIAIEMIKTKLEWIWNDLRWGVESGYPKCCVISYTLKHFLGIPQAGRFKMVNGNSYQSCVLHKGDSD